MLKPILALIFIFYCTFAAFAQQELIHPNERTQQAAITEPTPYMQVNKLPTIRQAFIANPHTIQNMEVYRGAEAIARFGDKAKDGAIVVQMNPNVQLVRLQEIYNHFKVPASQRSLKVCINHQLIKNADLILADLREVKKVEVIKQDVTGPSRWSVDEDEQFLNIVTAEKK